MIKIFFIALLFINTFALLSMEQICKIITSDGIQNEIPQKHLYLCNVIRTMAKDFPNNENPIPLPIPSEMLPLVKCCLKSIYDLEKNPNSNIYQKSLTIQISNPSNLYKVLMFANKLDVPELLKYCIQSWAKKKYSPQNYNLPSEINRQIAQKMKLSENLLNKAGTWVMKNLPKKDLYPIANFSASSIIHALDINNNGFVATGHFSGTISIYDPETNLFNFIKSNHISCTALQFNENNDHIFSSGGDGIIKIWNLANKSNIDTIQSPQCQAHVFRYIPQHNILIADGKEYKLCLWNLSHKNNNPVILDAHTDKITALKSTHNGSFFVSTSCDSHAKIWDIASKNLITMFYENGTEIMSADFNYANDKLACGLEDGRIIIYDPITKQKIQDEHKHTAGVRSILFVDGQDTLLCSGAKDSKIKIWDTRIYMPITTLPYHSDCIECLAVSLQKGLLVSASHDQTIKIWDLRKLVLPILSLRDELSKNCTIEDIFMLENATWQNPLTVNNSFKELLQKFSCRGQKFILDNTKAD